MAAGDFTVSNRYDAAEDRYFFYVDFTESGSQKYNAFIDRAKTFCSELAGDRLQLAATYTLHDGYEAVTRTEDVRIDMKNVCSGDG